MSIALIDWALRQDINPAPKVVLIALCDQISDQPGKEFFWGTQGWIAEKIHMGERQVREHLKTLEKEGWIRRVKRTTDSGQYTTDAIYVESQRRKPADGGKPSSPAAENSQNQRRKTATKNLIENLNENLKPCVLEEKPKRNDYPDSFEAFWKRYLAVWGSGGPKALAYQRWQKLRPGEREEAVYWLTQYHAFFKDKYSTASRVHCATNPSQKRWQEIADRKHPDAETVKLDPDSPEYEAEARRLAKEAGNPGVFDAFMDPNDHLYATIRVPP